MCMYICIYVYVCTFGVTHLLHMRACVHSDVCAYNVYLGSPVLSRGPAMRATHTYIRTCDVAAHCATVV